MNSHRFDVRAETIDAQLTRLVAHGAHGQPCASALLRPRIGLAMPRYWYHVGQVVHAAPALNLFRAQRTLLLGNDLTGMAELLDFQDLGAGDGDLRPAWTRIARAALALVAADPMRWGGGVLVELQGERDATGASPFWQGLTRHFYRGDAQDTAARVGPDWRSHLAALLPRQPVYVSFLPEAAQRAIGAHGPAAQTLHAALRDAGLQWRHHVTIDDGAVVLEWSDGAATEPSPP